MVRKWKHWIISFIVVGQYKLLSWRSIYFLSEGLDLLASIFLSYAASSRLIFRSWSNAVWLISFNKSKKYALKMLIIIFFNHWDLFEYRKNENIYLPTSLSFCLMWREFCWYMSWLFPNHLFLIHDIFVLHYLEVFQIIIIAFQNSKSLWKIVFQHPFRTF